MIKKAQKGLNCYNLNAILKRLVLPQEWKPKRMKAVRFSLIRLPGSSPEKNLDGGFGLC